MPRTRVIIINGAPTSGKDTFVDMAAQYCDMDESANVFNISSVDPIKDMLAGFGWDGQKSDNMRGMIAGIKQMWIDTQNGPTTFLFTNIFNYHVMHVDEDNLIFCHIREPEEIGKLVKVLDGMNVMNIDVKTMLISRMGVGSESDRESDDINNICAYNYDIIINNDGTLDQLQEMMENFVDKILEDK